MLVNLVESYASPAFLIGLDRVFHGSMPRDSASYYTIVMVLLRPLDVKNALSSWRETGKIRAVCLKAFGNGNFRETSAPYGK